MFLTRKIPAAIWEFRIINFWIIIFVFQGTIVNKDSFEQSVSNTFDDLKGKSLDDGSIDDSSKKDEWMLPSKIFGASCLLNKPENKGFDCVLNASNSDTYS
jgi:hypothetical protein